MAAAAFRPLKENTSGSADRYRLTFCTDQYGDARLQLLDSERGRLLFEWRGATARYLLNCDELSSVDRTRACCYACDKTLLCHLALVAAAAESLFSTLCLAERRVASTLFAHPGQHLCSNDVALLASMKQRSLHLDDIELGLAGLVRKQLIQKIVVDEHNVFYDIDTRQHEHVFDPATRCLSDA